MIGIKKNSGIKKCASRVHKSGGDQSLSLGCMCVCKYICTCMYIISAHMCFACMYAYMSDRGSMEWGNKGGLPKQKLALLIIYETRRARVFGSSQSVCVCVCLCGSAQCKLGR